MKSLLQAVGSIPFLALAALAAGLSAAPGVFVFLQIQNKASGLPEPLYYLAIGGALVAGYIAYGAALIFIAPVLNLLLGGRLLKPYKGKQVSLGILPWYIHATFTMLPRLTTRASALSRSPPPSPTPK